MDSDSYSRIEDILTKILSQFKAEDVLTPISKVVFIHVDDSYQEIVDTISKSCHACYPVYDDGVDNIVGLLHVKNLIDHNRPFSLLEKLEQPVFISENTKLDEMLDECIKRKLYFTIVVDEHGSVRGIITQTDIFTSLYCGKYSNIDGVEFVVEPDKPYLIDAELSLEEFNKQFGVDFDCKTYDTIGGYVIDKFTYVPHSGEQLVFDHLLISVVKTEGAKLQELMVVSAKNRSKI